ncbi:MAG: polysaccharide biosynthesis/export family protein [Thermoguttaceae bacterium]|jgi:polysaccharide export outer membrane protein
MPLRASCRRHGVSGLPIAVAALLLCAGGCASGRYYATTLPPDLAAPVLENMEAIDLSRLAHNAINSETVEPGDVLDVSMVTNYSTLTSTTTPVRIADNGTADVPLVGPVAVAGLDIEAVERAMAAAAVNRGIFQKPHITVTLSKPRSNRITVVGAVKLPGVYSLSRGSSSLLAALVAAGGLIEESGPEVEIRHSSGGPATAGGPLGQGGPGSLGGPASQQVVRVDLAKATAEGDRQYPISDGDVVVVHRRVQKPIYVMGLVLKPGEYKLPANQNLQVLDALAMAGDRSTQLADKVFVIRRLPGRPEPAVIEVSVREAKNNGKVNLRLAPGDIVSVEDTPITMVGRALSELLHFSVGAGYNLY